MGILLAAYDRKTIQRYTNYLVETGLKGEETSLARCVKNIDVEKNLKGSVSNLSRAVNIRVRNSPTKLLSS